METVGTALSPANEKRFQHWLRVLRPLSWWFLLVLVLYGKTSKPAKDAASAIASALLYGKPVFKINVNRSPQPETYEIVGQQDVSGGKRHCIIVCGQTRDDETQILFKVMEYKTKHNVTMPALLEFRDDLEYIPIHPSRITNMTDKLKAQVQAGVSNLTVRIQGAIGQTPTPAVQPAVSQ
jgi:hypothetical protein